MILTVTPGINLSSVTGPISKAQLNQLGQPTVAATPGSVVAGDTNFTQLRITDGVYPFLQLTNPSAPTDKKRFRAYLETSGTVGLARTNDAENVGFPLASWDTSNNTTLSGNLTVNGSIQNITGSIRGASDAIAWTLGAGSSMPGTAGSGAFVQLYGGAHPTFAGRTFFGSSTQTFGAVDPNGNWGFGTLLPGARVHVVGGDFLLENNRKISMPDASGSSPALICQSDNNFVFYGTGSAGASRPVYQMQMRSDTSAFQVNVPLKIGAAGVAFQSVLKATVSHNIGTLAAGAFLELTSTVTGAISGAMVHVGGGAPNNLILKGYSSTGDTVSVMYHNPSAASVNAGTRSIDLFVFNT